MHYNSLIVVGSSGSGKTTAVNAVRGPEFAARVSIPTRLITRPARLGDDTVENTHVTHEAFTAGVKAGFVIPYWERDLGGDTKERYGFKKPHRDEERLRIYSANNAFMRNSNETTEEVRSSGLVVLVYAARVERERRLFGRSPDITEVERAKRLSDNADDILNMAGVRMIDTTELEPAQTQAEFQKLVADVLASN